MWLHQFSPSYTLMYHYKHALFLFQYNIRKKLGKHPAGPLVRLPSCTRARAAPHLSCARGTQCQRPELIPLPRAEQEQGQHAPSPGYSVSSHRQRKLTGSSNPLCSYPLMTEHQRKKEKKTLKTEVAQQAVGLIPEKTIRKGSIGTKWACACELSGCECCLYLYLCYLPSTEGGNMPWNGICCRYNVGRQSRNVWCGFSLILSYRSR